jgi:hypothetical protein
VGPERIRFFRPSFVQGRGSDQGVFVPLRLAGHQRGAARPGYGGAEDDHRAVKLAQQVHQAVQQQAGVTVVGVHLVEDDHFAQQPEAAHKTMAHIRQNGQQGLIQGAHAKGRQNGPFEGIEPFPARFAFRSQFGVVQARVAVQQKTAALVRVRGQDFSRKLCVRWWILLEVRRVGRAK